MANFRYINTAMWKDPWFVELRLSEQHLFIYLITNPQTNMLGVYEMSLREMAFDTGIDQEEIKRIFRDRFTADGKSFYELGFVVMPNWLKHQQPNGNQLKNIKDVFNSLPEWLRENILDSQSKMFIHFESLLERSKAFESLSLKEKKIKEIKIKEYKKSGGAPKAKKADDKNHQQGPEQTQKLDIEDIPA